MSDPYSDLFDEIGPETPMAEFDEVWERLAAGEVGEAELSTLRARAEDDPEVARLLEMFSPLDEETERRRASAIQRARAMLPAPVVPPPAPPEPSLWDALRGWMRVLVPVLTLAVVGVTLLPTSAPPPFTVALLPGDAPTRGTVGGGTHAPGSLVELHVRTAVAADADVGLWLDGDPPLRLETQVQRAEDSLRLRAPLPDVDAPAGTEGTLLLQVSMGTPAIDDAVRVGFTWGE
jgi:hypothetical protein